MLSANTPHQPLLASERKTFRQAVGESAELAIPFALSRLVFAVQNFGNGAVIAELTSDAIAAAPVGFMIQYCGVGLSRGALAVFNHITGALNGEGKPEKIGLAINQAFVVATFLGVPMSVLFFTAPNWLPLLGINEGIAQQAGQFLRALSYGTLPSFWSGVDQNFLLSIKRPWSPAMLNTLSVGVSMAIGYPLALKNNDLAGLGYGQSIAGFVTFLISRLYLYFNVECDHLLISENANFSEIPRTFILGYVFCKKNDKIELFYYTKTESNGILLKLGLKQASGRQETQENFDAFLREIFAKSPEKPKIIQLSDNDFKRITSFTGHTHGEGVLVREKYQLFSFSIGFDSGTSFKEITRLSFPAALQALSEWLPTTLIALITANGRDADRILEAQEPAMQVLMTLNQIILGLGTAAAVSVATALGTAKKHNDANRTEQAEVWQKNARTIGYAELTMASLVMSPFMLFCTLYPTPLVQVFSDKSQDIQLAELMLRVTGATLLLDAVRITAGSNLLGRKNPADNFFTSLTNLLITAGTGVTLGYFSQKILGPLSFFIMRMIAIFITSCFLLYRWDYRSNTTDAAPAETTRGCLNFLGNPWGKTNNNTAITGDNDEEEKGEIRLSNMSSIKSDSNHT